MNGLVRLKTLFKRAREQAPNILFIRDLDFMTRHRERYPVFGSVRATTQLLLAMDGYSRGTETIASQQDIFVMGSDWEGKFDELKEYCKVIYFPRTKGISTTKLKSIIKE